MPVVTTASIEQLYVAFFNRPADPFGLAYWTVQANNNNGSVAAVANAFSASAEYTAVFGGLNAGDTINMVYMNLFGRPAEVAGLTFWAQALANGLPLSTIAQSIAAGAQNSDLVAVTSKVTYATTFTTTVALSAPQTLGYSGAAANAVAKAALLAIVDATTMATATTNINTTITSAVTANSGSSSGTTFTLTTGVDSLTGTSGNDIFIADNTGSAASVPVIQASVADTINGGAGNDTFKLYLNAATTTVSASTLPTLISIENLSISGGTLTSVNAAGIAGVTGLVMDSVVQATAAGNTAVTVAGQTITLSNMAGTIAGTAITSASTTTAGNAAAIAAATTAAVTAAALLDAKIITTTIASTSDTVENITLNKVVGGSHIATVTNTNTDSVAGAAAQPAQTRTVTDVQTLDFSGTKIATVNLTTTVAASTITLTNTGSALTALNIAGTVGLNLTESLTNLKTINASTATGAISVDTSGIAKTAAFAFTGGAGNDKLTLALGDLALITSGAQLGGGAGTDTLVIKDLTLATTDYAKLNAATSFEILGVAGSTGAVTFDASQITNIKEFAFNTANTGNTDTITNIGASTIIDITAATAITLGAAVGTSAITLNVGTASAAGFTTGALGLTGFTTIALTSNGTSLNTLGTLAMSDNTSITVTGSGDLTFALASGTSTGSKVDGSAFTGKLTVTGSTQGDILIGGSGADTLISGAKATTMTGGAGADNFNVVLAVNAGTVSTVGNMDTITDFVKGTDKITFANNIASFTTAAIVVTTASTLNAAANIAAATFGTTLGATDYFQYGGNTYVVQSGTTSSHANGILTADTIVKLTGIVDFSTAITSTLAPTVA